MARRFKLATTFNMIGLIVAFAAIYMLLPQIFYESRYNQGIKDYERMYRMESNYLYQEVASSDNVARPFAEALDSMPEVESYSLASNINYQNKFFLIKFKKGDKDTTLTYTQGNSKVVSTLTDRCIDGSIEWTEKDKDENGRFSSIIIPKSLAMDYFGKSKVAGDSLPYLDSWDKSTIKLPILGVYEDFDDNSDGWNCIYGYIDSDDSLSLNCNYRCIVKFKEFPLDIDAWNKSLKKRIIDKLKNDPDSLLKKQTIGENIRDVMATDFKFTPLKDCYFENNSYTTGNSGNKSLLVLLELMIFIVIIIATINFINFTLAESPMRIRSLNTRLVLGADRRKLQMGLIAECIIISVIACLIALAGCAILNAYGLLRPNLLVDENLSLSNHWLQAVMLLVIALVVGIVAGVYPAKFATSFPPVIALKGTFGLTPQGRKLLTGLVGMQLFISMLMVCYIGTLYLQRDYIFHSDYGFDKDRVLISTLPLYTDNAVNVRLHQQVMKIPGIQYISYSDTILGLTDSHNMNKLSSQGHPLSYRFISVDSNYLRTMGISIAKGMGRDFNGDDQAAVIINEAALHEWSWLKVNDKIPKSFENNDSATIVGVCRNIRYATTHLDNNKPFAIILDNDNEYKTTMNIRVADDADKELIRKQVNECIRNAFDGTMPDAVYFDKKLNESYDLDFRYYMIFMLLTVICLIFTSIGVFCITLFETEYRRKEIGIRKVAGATTGEIVWMLCRRYCWMILISFALAVPLAYFSGVITLNNFAQHASILVNWWIFPLSLLFVGGIMLGTVILQGWRTARQNPTESIKTE